MGLGSDGVSDLSGVESEGFDISERMFLLLMAVLMDGDIASQFWGRVAEIRSNEEFEQEFQDCPYRREEKYGNAYEQLCSHTDRRGESPWVMCGKELCPLLIRRLVNSTAFDVDLKSAVNAWAEYGKGKKEA